MRPGGEWDRAETVYHSDFQQAFAGAFPGRWRIVSHGNTVRSLVIGRIRDGGHVLFITNPDGESGNVSVALPMGHKLVGGRLCVQFDMLRLDEDSGTTHIRLIDDRGPADVGWPRAEEHGPFLTYRWSDAQWQYGTWTREMADLPGGALEADRWHRIALIADIDEAAFDLFVDGAAVAEAVDFKDHSRFIGADELRIDTDRTLLDNVSVLYLPGKNQRERIGPERPAPPTISAGQLRDAPKLDGRIDERLWHGAYHTDRFFTLLGPPSKEPRTETWIGYHGEDLYVAVRLWPVDAKAMDEIREQARVTHPPGTRVWGHFEIFIDPSAATRGDKYVHLAFDAGGNRCDELGMGKHWGGTWQVATHVEREFLSAEVRVPFASLTAVCPPEKVWSINVCRGGFFGGDGNAAIAPTYGNFHANIHFPRLDGLPPVATSPTRCVLDLAQPLTTAVGKARLIVSGEDIPAGTELRATVTAKSGGKVVATHATAFTRGSSGEKQAVSIELPLDAPGDYYWKGEISASGPAPIAESQTVFGPVSAAGTLRLRTDLNYYTHETTARVRGTLLGRDLPDDGSAILEVSDSAGETLLSAKCAIDGSPFVASVPLQELPLGSFSLAVRIVGEESREIAHATTPLIRRLAKANEVKIRWDNFLIVESRPFFPIFFYTGDMIKAHELGANTVLGRHGSWITRNMSLAHRFGLRLILWPPSAEWADNPLLLGWYMEDEPKATADGRPQQKIIDMVAAAREASPYHISHINLSSGWTDALAYAGVSDTIGQDPYACAGSYREKFVGESTRVMHQVTRGRQPVFQVLQGFHFKGDDHHPTPRDFRHAVYSTIIHGAHGIGFWGLDLRNGMPHEDIRGLGSDPKLWQEFGRVLRAVRRLSPVITSDEPVPGPAGSDNDEVAVMTKVWKGKTYIWLLNMTQQQQDATIDAPMSTEVLLNRIRPDGRVNLRNGKFTVTLAPLQPMVLAREP
ncbi:MAG: hypothetical protein CMJ18_12310 [Phycisphaeraceae bacterium]|nr:hypothetical protein [Phycisphaeraceae bacterium]